MPKMRSIGQSIWKVMAWEHGHTGRHADRQTCANLYLSTLAGGNKAYLFDFRTVKKINRRFTMYNFMTSLALATH